MNGHKQPTITGDEQPSAPVSASDNPAPSPRTPAPALLAVDCGLKTGLALYTVDGQLLWYRSHNFGNRQRLKKAVWQILKEHDGLGQLVIEGGGDLAEVWTREGRKRGLEVVLVQAEQWRKDLLLPRQQRTGKQAKQVAGELAREVIAQAGGEKPTSLRHDAAEAVLVGWWKLQE